MNERTPTATGRRMLAPIVVVFALLASTLAFSAVTAAPAQADTGSTPGYGFKKVLNKSEYLVAEFARNGILHVDEDHSDSTGFWFAHKTDGGRGFGWGYQKYGKWCGASAYTVVWNPWMNKYWCAVDETNPAVAAEFPDYSTWTAACKTETGYPWKEAEFRAYQQCGDRMLDHGSLEAGRRNQMPISSYSPEYFPCAPWEDQGLNADGSGKCFEQTYEWADDAVNTEWIPAPDACTGLPATWNVDGGGDPALFAPATGGDGTCTGADPAPNCATAPGDIATTHQACTGIEAQEPVYFTGTATSTQTAEVTTSATVTKSSTAKVLRWSSLVRVTKWYRGKRYVGKAYARVYATRTRTATVTRTATASATATATQTCQRTSQDEADACAQVLADTLATGNAQAAALTKARSTALSLAGTYARSLSRSRAIAAARSVPITLSMKRAAVSAAKRIALRQIDAQIGR